MSIDPLIEAFGWGTPACNTLDAEFMRRALEEGARHHMGHRVGVATCAAIPVA